MTRSKFTRKIKTKVVLEALKRQYSLAELVQKYEIHPIKISVWQRDFLKETEQIFELGKMDTRM
mgnify:CR=1 FL=1